MPLLHYYTEHYVMHFLFTLILWFPIDKSLQLTYQHNRFTKTVQLISVENHDAFLTGSVPRTSASACLMACTAGTACQQESVMFDDASLQCRCGVDYIVDDANPGTVNVTLYNVNFRGKEKPCATLQVPHGSLWIICR